MPYQWDFFIAHAGPDQEPAELLYESLSKKSKVFLDSKCILYGDDWDQEIAQAQRRSFITIVLVSSFTGKAYYQREEIASAIDMARKDSKKHRVIPIILDDKILDKDIPYGLRLKHRLVVSDTNSLESIADSLVDLLSKLRDKSLLGSKDLLETSNTIDLKIAAPSNLLSRFHNVATDTSKLFDRIIILPKDCDLALRNLGTLRGYLKQLFDFIEEGQIEIPHNIISAHGSRLVIWHKVDLLLNHLNESIKMFRGCCLNRDKISIQIKNGIQDEIQELIKVVSFTT
jgi:hypothetical protein